MMIEGYEVIGWSGAAFAAQLAPGPEGWTPRDPVPFVRPAGSADVLVMLTSPYGNRYALPVQAAAAYRLISRELAETAALGEQGQATLAITPDDLAAESRGVAETLAAADRVDAAEAVRRPGLADDLAESAGNVAGAIGSALGGVAGLVGGALGQGARSALIQAGPIGTALVIGILIFGVSRLARA